MNRKHGSVTIRRVTAFILILCIGAALFACNSDEAQNIESNSPDDQSSSTSPTPTPTPLYESVMIGTVVNVNTFLNVRSGPGTEYEAIGTARAGDTFTVTLKFVDGGYWHKIEYGDAEAYVHSDYLEVTTELIEITG